MIIRYVSRKWCTKKNQEPRTKSQEPRVKNQDWGKDKRQACRRKVDGQWHSDDGIFILKLNTWVDRHAEHSKDAADMGFMLNNYLSVNEERAAREHFDEIYSMDDFNYKTSGAKLLGMDMTKIIGDNKKTKTKLIEIILLTILA